MITIIEGTDGTGKSTYAAWLGVRQGGVLLHFGRPDDDPLEMHIGRVARWANDEAVVLDRSFVGSRVWSALGFHRPVLDDATWRSVCRWYATRGGRCLILVRPAAAVDAELAARGEGFAERHASNSAQAEYLRMVRDRAVLYMPVAICSSDLIHSTINHHEGN